MTQGAEIEFLRMCARTSRNRRVRLAIEAQIMDMLGETSRRVVKISVPRPSLEDIQIGGINPVF